MSYHLIDLVQSIESPHLLVLGDLILDRYVWGNAERISQEAPVILLREEKQEERLGGAANVANMLIGLEAKVTMAGVVGADDDGQRVISLLKKSGVNCDSIIADANRPTTVKQRMIGHAQHRHPHQMLRIDRESREQLDRVTFTKLLDRILSQLSQYDAVLISDYAKGVCTPRLLEQLIEACRAQGIPAIVDPAPTEDYSIYRGATAMTPNRTETAKATGLPIESYKEAWAAGQKLVDELQMDHIFVTLDRDGIAIVQNDGQTQAHPTRQRDVYDITGAGDMVLATIGLGAAAGFEVADLARLANISGGLEVEQVGVVCINKDQIVEDLLHEGRNELDKHCPAEVASRHIRARQKLGQKVVFTNGCFDVLHIGHVSYLKQARAEGDCLVVGLNSDSSVRSQGKAPDRPIFPEQQRAEMLSALEPVDYVVLFDEQTPEALLQQLRPDVLVKGGTYQLNEVVGADLVQSYGGSVKVLGEIPGVSSTTILNRLRGETSPSTIPLSSSETPSSDQSQRKAG